MLRDIAYRLYTRKLLRELAGAPLPGHVGLIMDGNRRWARQMRLASPSLGHKYGAEHVEDVLHWCDRADIARHLYTAGQPDPDLVIRTSGELRSSNFLLWQSVASELYFCDAYWPAFREIDFLRALRNYAAAQRRRDR